MHMANATQRPGQTKQQTKLIAQGVQKGIEQYKKKQREKARELDKKLKKVAAQLEKQEQLTPSLPQVEPKCRSVLLPWVLLALTWLGIIVFGLLQTH